MDLTQIRHFLALADTLNFTRAAEACNITQPAFTRSIQRLEEELGGPLILRERALTHLTDLGRAMLPLLQRTRDAAEAVRARAADHRRAADAAPLRLGLAPMVRMAALLPVLREVAGRVQELDLTLRRGSAPALVDALLRGDLDVAVLPEEAAPLPDRLNRWPLWPERLVLLAPEGHALAAVGALKAAALDGAVLVTADPPGTHDAALERLGSEHGIRLTLRHRGGEADIGTLVALGLGVALAPAGSPLPPGVVARALVAPELSHSIVLSTAAGRPMNRAVGAFTKLARARDWSDASAAA